MSSFIRSSTSSLGQRARRTWRCRGLRDAPGAARRGVPWGGVWASSVTGCALGKFRGPLTADDAAAVHTLRVRRYRCVGCAAIVTVLPRGATRARHFSATAIALACAMYALSGASLRATRARVSPWRSAEPGWPAMGRWLHAIAGGSIFATVRAWPRRWPRRRQAERVAQAVLAVAPGHGSWAVRIFAGAERLACT